jgi:hypothetical protein
MKIQKKKKTLLIMAELTISSNQKLFLCRQVRLPLARLTRFPIKNRTKSRPKLKHIIYDKKPKNFTQWKDGGFVNGGSGEEANYQDQVGHLETRLSPARMNSLTLRTPFSLKAETVRGPVILSTVPLNASWIFCDRTISPIF